MTETRPLQRYELAYRRDPKSDWGESRAFIDPHPEGNFVLFEDVQALFTPEDVQALNYIARAYALGDPEDYPVHLRSVAARIAALLPK